MLLLSFKKDYKNKMKNTIKLTILMLICINLLDAKPLNTGEDVFRAYCWGCHHQTAQAFGPSFAQIADTRTKGQIQGHITAPKSMYKNLGYKRSVMPAFGETLKQEELNLITKFILSFKGKI
jgi:mono/diheme cytochrome c family protein